MMSWIEKHVFAVLLRQETASIKDMKPADMPANQFSYHLNNLIRKKYITKMARGKYVLTPLGLNFAGTMSTETNDHRENMKTVIMLYGRATDGRVGLFRWSRQPYMGSATLPYDRVAYDDTLEAALHRASTDKLGVVVAMKYKVSVFMTVTHQGQIISRMHGLVYEYDPKDVSFPCERRNGTLFLAAADECIDLMSGGRTFLERLQEYQGNGPIEVTLSY
jgi:ADP-ribose pyrophosphatase YjhB (NUDIX family)